MIWARRNRSRISSLLAWICVLATAACAPQFQKPGTELRAPLLGQDHILTTDGARLPLRVWAASDQRAIVIAVHGFNDYSRAFEWPAAYWARNGITTYAYDQRGFGKTAYTGIWPRADVLVRDLMEVTALVRHQHPEAPIYLLGESMGGAVVLAAMGRPDAPDGVAGIVLVAPAVWGWASMNVFYQTALWVGAHTIPWKTFTGKHLDILPCDNILALRQLARDPLVIKATRTDTIYGLVNLMDEGYFAASQISVPTLILYGDHDEIVPDHAVREMVRRLHTAHRFVRYPHGYHMLLRDREGPLLWRDIRDWTRDRDAPLYGQDVPQDNPLTQSAHS